MSAHQRTCGPGTYDWQHNGRVTAALLEPSAANVRWLHSVSRVRHSAEDVGICTYASLGVYGSYFVGSTPGTTLA